MPNFSIDVDADTNVNTDHPWKRPLHRFAKCNWLITFIQRLSSSWFRPRPYQRELFLSEVNNRETIAATEANNETYCLQKRIENVPLVTEIKLLSCMLKSVKIRIPITHNQSDLGYQLATNQSDLGYQLATKLEFPKSSTNSPVWMNVCFQGLV